MPYEKIDDTNFKEVKQTEVNYNIDQIGRMIKVYDERIGRMQVEK